MKKVTLWMVLTILLMLTTDVFSQQTKSIFDELTSTSYDEVDVMIQRYHKLKKEKIEEYNFSNEWELNKLGYQLMSEDRIDDAIKIFQLLIEEFPTSFNPYDSMGEAYMKQGKDKLAIENYQKSLELNPDNQNAYRMMLNMQFENRDKDKFSKVYSKQKYENDLDELAKTLTEVNPSPYKFISKEKFWGDVEDKKKMISDSTTYAEFVWHCSQIVANIGCVHSAIIYYFKQEEEMLPDSLRFPLEVKLIDGRMYVSDPLVNFDKINPKTEIFQINGKSTEEIKALIFPHISTQGTNVSGKRQMFNTYGSAMIAYALNFPNSYEVVLKDQKAPINLNPLKSYKHKPLRSNAVNICEDQLCLEIIDDQTALLTIKNWVYYGQRFSIFKAFIDSSFYEIEKKNIKNLVIDLRGNGGGSSDAGIYLLQHLAKKPFVYFRKAASEKSNKVFNPLENKFKGTTYFLCDGFGGSVTGHFLSIVKHLKMGLIIGEELGGNKYCTGGQLTYKLSNTDMFYCVGRFVHISESESISDERGVFPDHFISPQIKDYINDVDVELEYTLDLIDKAK